MEQQELRPQPRAGHPALKLLKNQRGVALMATLATVAFMIYLAVEVMYDSSVDYNVNAQELNRMKAYYAARGAMEIGLLRVKIYQSVKSRLGESANAIPFIDQIWGFPIQWPFPTELLGTVAKEELEEDAEESLMDAKYDLSIADEGSKIDINDLGSESETIQKSTEKMIRAFFEEKIRTDENFRREYGTFRFDELINSMKDWMSSKWSSANGGDKRAAFSDFQSQELPPNRGFRTIGELRMLPLMDDNLFEILEPRITVYGIKGVNPNTATSAALQMLDPGITSEIAEMVIQQREKEPFASAAKFFEFLNEKNARLVARSVDDLSVTMDTLTSFRITATGEFAGVQKAITIVTMNLSNTAKKLKDQLDKDKNAAAGGTASTTGTSQPGTTPTTQKKETISKGPPRIVYWYEQ